MLLTTREAAALLKVHPKQVYRLLRRGLPAHRIGDEWRLDAEEVLRYSRERGEVTPRSAGAVSVEEQAGEGVDMRQAASSPPWTPRLIAANGDLVVELLLEGARQGPGGYLGLVMADHDSGLRLLGAGTVLVSGCHGEAPPPAMRARRGAGGGGQGLLVRAESLGDAPMTALCEATQSAQLRKSLAQGFGYDTARTGELRVCPARDAR